MAKNNLNIYFAVRFRIYRLGCGRYKGIYFFRPHTLRGANSHYISISGWRTTCLYGVSYSRGSLMM